MNFRQRIQLVLFQITLIIIGLLILREGFKVISIPSENPIYFGRYSLAKLVAICVSVSIGITLITSGFLAYKIIQLPVIFKVPIVCHRFLSRYHRSVTYLTLFFLVTLIFTLSTTFPFELNSDISFQIKSVQQLLRGESQLLNFVAVPNPKDLSQDVQFWISQWSPGIPIFFLPLIAIGLPLGVAGRLGAYILFLSGCVGWIKIADKIQTSIYAKLLLALTLPLYAITPEGVGGAVRLQGDLLPFAVFPWLTLYTLNLSLSFKSGKQTYRQLILHTGILGFLTGAVYWLKYTGLPGAVGLFVYLVLCYLVLPSPSICSLRKRLYLAAIYAFSLGIPVICLILSDRYLSGISAVANVLVSESPTAAAQYGGTKYPKHIHGIEGVGLLISLLGSPGLALFQTEFWLRQKIEILSSQLSNVVMIIPFLKYFAIKQNNLKIAMAGIPGTVALIYVFLNSKKIYSRQIILLGLCITFIPFLLFAHISSRVGFNALIGLHTVRYMSPFLIFAEIIFLGVCIHFIFKSSKIKLKTIFTLVLIAFFVLPNIFILDRANGFTRATSYSKFVTTANNLHGNSLSKNNEQSVVDTIDALIRSPQDIVVLALPSDSSSWLELKHRSFPYAALRKGQYGGTLGRLYGSQKFFTTSKDLRVILVISKYFDKREAGASLVKMRFAQAGEWNSIPTDSDTLVNIWFTDIKVS